MEAAYRTEPQWEGYITTYPPYYPYIPFTTHGPCPTCGKCRCCDGKKEYQITPIVPYGTWTNNDAQTTAGDTG